MQLIPLPEYPGKQSHLKSGARLVQVAYTGWQLSRSRSHSLMSEMKDRNMKSGILIESDRGDAKSPVTK